MHFFVLFAFNTSTFMMSLVSDVYINDSIAFLREQIPRHSGPKYIVVHYPVYSAGEFGSHPLLTRQIEQILHEFEESEILGVICGHDHVFSAFRRKNVLVAVAASGGGTLDSTDHLPLGRSWPSGAHELHGPLDKIGDVDRCLGYELHLDSFRKFTRTEVKLDLEKRVAKYVVRDLETWSVLAEYVFDF